MDISFVTRKFQRSIAGLGLATILATSVFTGTAFGMTFDDVDSDHFAYDQIDALSDAGVMTGYEGTNNFGPDDYLTREQAAKVLVMAFATVDTSASVTCTGDVSDWAVDYVATANQLGIMEGDDEGNCNASDGVLRAEFAKMAVTAAGLSSDGTMASDWFDDVVAGAWYDEYMGTAYVYGVMGGYENGDMGPGDNVTRGQAAKMTYNAQNPVYNPPSEGDDDDDDDTTTGGGSLEVILSNDSPEDYTYFSAGTNAEVASFELTASDEDVVVTSFEVELASGDNDSILALALYDEAGTRISKVDTSIDTDDMSRMTMLDGGYTVEAGSSVVFRLMNTFAATTDTPAANTSTLYSYAFDSSMIESDAGTVEVENDLVTGIFGLLDNNTGAITVDDVDVATDVQVGETDVELFTFEITETSSDKDVWVSGITFENTGTANLEDALNDLALYFDGDMVAEGTQFGDYISFQMDSDVAPLIEAGNNESFEVRARVIGESSETLIFGIEETLDVRAMDEDDNDVAVTSTFATGTTNVEAGAISVVAYDAETDKFRADREDVELGRFEVTPGTDGMTLNTVNLDFALTQEEDDNAEAWYVSDLFENFVVTVNGSRNSLDLDGAEGASEAYTVDVDKTLAEGTVYEFVVYADTVTTTAAAATATADDRDGVTYDVDSYTNFAIEMSLTGLGDGATTDGLVVEEDASGDAVTDFTPSSVSFNDLQGETAGVDISALALSSAKDAVVGSNDVLALEFEVEESADVSDLTIKDLNAYITVDEDGDATYAEAGEDADSSNISSVDLYQVNADDTETLLDSVSGSSLGTTDSAEGTPVNFDFSDLTVAQNSTETFRIYVSFVDDSGLNGDDFRATAGSYDIRDDENNQVYDAGDADVDGDFTGADTAPWSGRTINLVATGTLYISVDNTDDTYGTESPRWLLAGEDGVGLMTIEVRAENEDVVMEEYTLTAASAEDNLSTYFSTIYIYDENGVLVGSQSLDDETTFVYFDGSSTELTAYAGETVTYYFVADLLPYGKEFAGAVDGAAATPTASFSLGMDVVTGVDSNDTYTDGDDDGTAEAAEVVFEGTENGTENTAATELWDVVATRISTVEFVDVAPTGEEIDSVLTGGENLVAILAVTADDTDNTQSDGTDIETILNEVNINMYYSLTAGTPSAVRLDLLGDSATVAATDTTPNSSGVAVEFVLEDTTSDVDGVGFDDLTDREIDPGETIYLAVYATVALGANDGEYIQVKVDSINADWLDWDDSAAATNRDTVYMGTTTRLTATKVTEI